MSIYLFELYISAVSPSSLKISESLKEILDTYLPGRYELEIINAETNPVRAEKARILTYPTLIKTSPAPVTRLIGGLSIKSRVLAGLEISPVADVTTG